MADFDFELPSFSLGLDSDDDSEPKPAAPSDPLSARADSVSTAANLPTIVEDDEDGFESPVRVFDQPPALKRLRRGLTPQLESDAKTAGREDGTRYDVDDEIEEFSSDEDLPKGNLPPNSICGSSKASLRGHKVRTSESGSHWKSVKGKEVSSALASANIETKGGNVRFPKLTQSPLRRFQLIDSDSDDDYPSVIEGSGREVPVSGLGTEKASAENCPNDDLWKGFYSEEKFHIPTPAFDEVCNEYFLNIRNKSQADNGLRKDPNIERNLDGTGPPSHIYFFHNDSRIQKLVRDRLPYFFPLGAGNNLEHNRQNASVIDYMAQFGHDENSRQANRQQPVGEKSSSRRKNNTKKFQVEGASQDCNNWVSPKSSARPPKNTGNRRVQAVSDSDGVNAGAGAGAGQWYTNSSGRKVYVSKNGQELSGRTAYRQYRKESGMGFKRSKKKSAAKKKSGSQKKAASKK
ncbi:uncharacterized protein LOC127247598 [Andrographis paniculata]|uniref:uncharacterized protein LOC127247598 n=1 Tax=Andrographis paniculata TaxID=175694 RepID=UPI0021E7092E|nr:uncharacterized protein LOC127247598 [Andrographis paniculata]